MKEAKRYDKVFKATWIKLNKKVRKIEGEEISYKGVREIFKSENILIITLFLY